jgi:hypothetical protein
MEGDQGGREISLETLCLVAADPSLTELPSFLLPLPTIAPRLARLELTLNPALGKGFQASLQ